MREPMMDSIDVAYTLRMSVAKVCAMARDGKIPHTREGNAYRFDPLEFRRWHREYKKRRATRSTGYTQTEIDQMSHDDGTVYFVQAVGVGGGLIKIGKTDNLARRFETLQSHSPIKLQILTTTGGGMRREYELHEQFKASRSHGEWFEPTHELLALIEWIKGHRRGTD